MTSPDPHRTARIDRPRPPALRADCRRARRRSSSARALGLALGLGVLVAACGDSGDATDSGAGSGSGTDGAAIAEPGNAAPPAPDFVLADDTPNVVIMLVDTLRADHLGAYGYERDTSPFLDRLAREQLALFEHAWSQAPWTLPSTVSLFTSTYPPGHGVVSNSHKAGESAETMAEWFDALGFRTAALVHNTLGGSGAGLDQGYDDFWEKPPLRLMTDEDRARGLHTIEPAIEFLRGYDGEAPFFLYVHTIEPHHPYNGSPDGTVPFAPEGAFDLQVANDLVPDMRSLLGQENKGILDEAGRAQLADLRARIPELEPTVEALYDGDVRRADQKVARVVSALRERGAWNDTIFVFLSDHGEEFNDHGTWSHDQSVYEELIHVPFMIRIPGVTRPGSRIARPVELLDLLPTLADALGAPAREGWRGRSLLPLLDGTAAPDQPATVFTSRMNMDRLDIVDRGEKEVAMRRGRWKAIVHYDVQRTSLYDLAEDPGELRDVAAEHPERTTAMRDEILAWWAAEQSSAPGILDLDGMDPEKYEAMLQMGYIDAAGGGPGGGADRGPPGAGGGDGSTGDDADDGHGH